MAYGAAATLSTQAVGSGLGGGGQSLARGVDILQGSIIQANQAAIDNLPKGYKSIVVRCWGNQRTDRRKLVVYALAVAATRMGNTPRSQTMDREIRVTQDSSNYVMVQHTVRWGVELITGLFTGLVNGEFLQAFNNVNPVFDPKVRNPETRVDGVSHTQSLDDNVAFPADSGTRGTASLPNLQILVTQTLEGFDGTPALVP
jgi:hypothetical protein